MLSENIGFIVGVIVGAAAVLIIRYNYKKKGKLPEYDERQKQEQAKATSIAFWILLGWCIIAGISYLFELLSINPYIIFLSGVIISTAVYSIYCVFKEAYFGIKRSSIGGTILIFAIGILNVAIFFVSQHGENEISNTLVVNLLCGIMCITVPGAILLKYLLDSRKGNHSEDDDNDEDGDNEDKITEVSGSKIPAEESEIFAEEEAL